MPRYYYTALLLQAMLCSYFNPAKFDSLQSISLLHTLYPLSALKLVLNYTTSA
jgi:hypothetical protein